MSKEVIFSQEDVWCDSCGWKTKVTVFEEFNLCLVCYASPIANSHIYPEQHSHEERKLLKTIAICTNLVLEAIRRCT